MGCRPETGLGAGSADLAAAGKIYGDGLKVFQRARRDLFAFISLTRTF